MIEEGDKKRIEGLLDRDNPELDPFDRIMLERADAAADNPWLEISVMSHIESREKARVWLSDNGSLFEGKTGNSAFKGIAGTMYQVAEDLISSARNTRFWATIGAALGGGLVAYFIAACLETPDPTALVSTTMVSAIAGVLAAGTAVQLPYLREFYS